MRNQDQSNQRSRAAYFRQLKTVFESKPAISNTITHLRAVTTHFRLITAVSERFWLSTHALAAFGYLYSFLSIIAHFRAILCVLTRFWNPAHVHEPLHTFLNILNTYQPFLSIFNCQCPYLPISIHSWPILFISNHFHSAAPVLTHFHSLLVIESPVRSGYLALEPSNRTLTG